MAAALRVLLAIVLTGTAWTTITAALALPAPGTPRPPALVDWCALDLVAAPVCRTPGPDPPARPSP